MNRSKTRSLVALLAISTAAACSTNRAYMADGDVDLSLAAPAELGTTEITRLRQMSDANILGHLMALDSLEVTMADTALRHIRSGDVGAYAKMMHLMHNDDWKELRDLAGASGLIPTIDVTKLSSSHIAAGIDSIRKTSDITKDQIFMRAQIDLHRHALAELQILEGVARNTALRQHIADMIPAVRDHLARARMIAKPLGVK
jgi:predicted outer membrane protein